MAESSSESTLDRYSKENRWYYKSIDNHVNPASRKLLETYSHIQPENIDSHIYKLRDILWSHAPYPCVGEFKFLTLNLPSHPIYTQILNKLNKVAVAHDPSFSAPPAYFLDLGCCVGQELRSLAHQGIPPEFLYGSDLNPHFLQTSYDLFKDKETFTSKLVPADIFSPRLWEEPFQGWEDKFNIIHAGLFLHLFSWEQQIDVCCKVVKLMSKIEGSLFVGEMVGCAGGGERSEGKGAKFWKNGEERRQFLHDEESFQTLWADVAEKTDTVGKWEVKGDLKVRKKAKGPSEGCAFFTGEGIGWFVFSVERVSL